MDSIIGLDIDQEFFVACLLIGERQHTRKFDNDSAGFNKLTEWLKRMGVGEVFACLEATGRYGNKLALHLHTEGHRVSIINPAFIASHKATLNRQNKTDPKDAEAIADYARCFQHRLRIWKPTTPEHQALIDVVGQIAALKKMQTMNSNRLQSGIETPGVLDSIRRILDQIEAELSKMEALQERLYDSLPELAEIREIAKSVLGIGAVSSTLLAARIDFADFKNGRDLAAFLGLSPREWKSGKQRRRGKATKSGDKSIRAALRMGALSVLRNAYYASFVKRLEKRGLTNEQILTAVARKMILIVHALVRKGQLFDCCYKYAA